MDAEKIYYPTAFYAELFNALGKPTFPSFHSYKFALNKIRQTAIFKMLDLPHPKTKIFYGKKQKSSITEYFKYPFIAKKAVGSAKGCHVFLIENQKDLETYLNDYSPAYIQEYLPIDRDMRIIVIGNKIRLGYWRIACDQTFKTNLSQGGKINFDPLPEQALDLALEAARKCGLDDVGIDIIEHEKKFYILECNIKYGVKGFAKAGIDYKKMMRDLILTGEI